MKKIGLFYGYKGGNTEEVAKMVASNFAEEDIDLFDLAKISLLKLEEYEQFIFGISTIGADNWTDASSKNHWDNLFMLMGKMDLKGKKAAIFGLGNQVLYPDHFCDHMALLKEKLVTQGVKVIGYTSNEGYDFKDSTALEGSKFVGLPLDHDNYPENTEKIVSKWTDQLKKEFS